MQCTHTNHESTDFDAVVLRLVQLLQYRRRLLDHSGALLLLWCRVDERFNRTFLHINKHTSFFHIIFFTHSQMMLSDGQYEGYPGCKDYCQNNFQKFQLDILPNTANYYYYGNEYPNEFHLKTHTEQHSTSYFSSCFSHVVDIQLTEA